MIQSLNNLIVQLSRFVGWYGAFSIDGEITFFDIALWFLILRLIPVIMKMISKISKKHYRSHAKGV